MLTITSSGNAGNAEDKSWVSGFLVIAYARRGAQISGFERIVNIFQGHRVTTDWRSKGGTTYVRRPISDSNDPYKTCVLDRQPKSQRDACFIYICIFIYIYIYEHIKIDTDRSTWMKPMGMIESPNGSIFRVTGLLYGEFTGHRWIPLTKASDAELWLFLWSAWTDAWVNNRDTGNLRRHRAHYSVTVMGLSSRWASELVWRDLTIFTFDVRHLK